MLQRAFLVPFKVLYNGILLYFHCQANPSKLKLVLKYNKDNEVQVRTILQANGPANLISIKKDFRDAKVSGVTEAVGALGN